MPGENSQGVRVKSQDVGCRLRVLCPLPYTRIIGMRHELLLRSIKVPHVIRLAGRENEFVCRCASQDLSYGFVAHEPGSEHPTAEASTLWTSFNLVSEHGVGRVDAQDQITGGQLGDETHVRLVAVEGTGPTSGLEIIQKD